MGIKSHAIAAGGNDPLNPPWAGPEVGRWILGVNPALDRMAAGHDVFLGEAEWESAALGQPDYYNWYRDECKRMRREIIARY